MIFLFTQWAKFFACLDWLLSMIYWTTVAWMTCETFSLLYCIKEMCPCCHGDLFSNRSLRHTATWTLFVKWIFTEHFNLPAECSKINYCPCFHYFLFQERQVKLAYVMTEAKPPREVRRKQAKFGTGSGIHPSGPPVAVAVPSRGSAQANHRTLNSAPSKKQAGIWENYFSFHSCNKFLSYFDLGRACPAGPTLRGLPKWSDPDSVTNYQAYLVRSSKVRYPSETCLCFKYLH